VRDWVCEGGLSEGLGQGVGLSEGLGVWGRVQ
jgi:hypothetical protein